MLCIICYSEIPPKRLEVIKTDRCVNCSSSSKKKGIMVWDKTTPELIICEDGEFQDYKKISSFNAYGLK